MKNCELCKGLARMHCESDQASLCWSCDYKVHSANFLVARHSRTLLCNVCQSPTPWTAAGLKLGHSLSVCDRCVQNYDKINANEESGATDEDEEIEPEVESDDFEDDEEEYDEEEDTDCEDNQVVPWSPSTPPPPSAASSPSNSDEESYSSSSSLSSPCDRREAQRKRTRVNADRGSNVNIVSTSSRGNVDIPPATTVAVSAAAGDGCGVGEDGRVDLVDSLSTIAEKSLKKRRTGTGGAEIPGSRSWAVIESVKRLHKQEMRSSAAIAELRRLSEDPAAVDYESLETS